MNKEQYIEILSNKMTNKNGYDIFLNQINKYYDVKSKFKSSNHHYKVGDDVFLTKGILLHGTYKNIDGLKEIIKDGLISSWFIDGRLSKYPSSVGVWNLKQDYYLKDYIDFYSGATILCSGIFKDGINTKLNKTSVVSYSKMNTLLDIVKDYDCHMWTLEQTKEARFMPSLIQDRIQIGIIFDGESNEIKELLRGDILNSNFINDVDVKEFVNENYYERFIIDRKNKDDFFTDRESAVIFGIPSCFIEGVLVGRKYENDIKILEEIKKLLPDSYICNLDGKVIVE